MDDIMTRTYRYIDINIFVLDYKFDVIDEISGLAESANFSIDNNSDIRRTADISMVLQSNYTKSGILHTDYFAAGNLYWFDKYLRIQIGLKDSETQETTWYKQGIYLINEPSMTYDAETNSLSFQGVDLMAKMTGLRNGYMEGQPYSIPVLNPDGTPTNNTVVEAMKSILQLHNFERYQIDTPENNLIPYDINLDVGSTTYDLLCELRDINPQWEMFFDVDGVFRFQKIPSGGKVDAYGNIEYENHPTTMVTDEEWDKLLLNLSVATDFSEVKNYCEVYGKTVEMEGMVQATNVTWYDFSHNLRANLPFTFPTSTPTFVTVTVGNVSQEPYEFPKHISAMMFTDANGVEKQQYPIRPVLKYVNMAYLFKINGNTIEYQGYLQPQAVAWENNPDSPFYVGELINVEPLQYSNTEVYTMGDYVKFNNVIYKCTRYNICGIDPTNTNVWRTDPTFKAAFNRWSATTDYIKYEIVYHNKRLWECIVTPDAGAHPIPSDNSPNWSALNSIDAAYGKLPIFKNMVRGIFVGDEYDNIFTNKIALENARFALYNHCRRHDVINITCVPIYDLDVSKVISLTLPNENRPSYWLITSISTEFSITGTQSISAIRYYPQYPTFGYDDL